MSDGLEAGLRRTKLMFLLTLLLVTGLAGFINVASAHDPVILPASIPSEVELGESLTVVFYFEDHPGLCAVWELEGSLPPGLRFEQINSEGCESGKFKNARISGTAGEVGEFTFTVKATVVEYGEFPYTGSRTYTIRVTAEERTDFRLTVEPEEIYCDVTAVLYPIPYDEGGRNNVGCVRNFPSSERQYIEIRTIHLSGPGQTLNIRVEGLPDFIVISHRRQMSVDDLIEIGFDFYKRDSSDIRLGRYTGRVVAVTEDGATVRSVEFRVWIIGTRGDLAIESVTPIQGVYDSSVLIAKKNTVFVVKYSSTFPFTLENIQMQIRLPCDQWYFGGGICPYVLEKTINITQGEHYELFDPKRGDRVIGGFIAGTYQEDLLFVKVPFRPYPKLPDGERIPESWRTSVTAVIDSSNIVKEVDETENSVSWSFRTIYTGDITLVYVPIVPSEEYHNFVSDLSNGSARTLRGADGRYVGTIYMSPLLQALLREVNQSVATLLDLYPVAESHVTFELWPWPLRLSDTSWRDILGYDKDYATYDIEGQLADWARRMYRGRYGGTPYYPDGSGRSPRIFVAGLILGEYVDRYVWTPGGGNWVGITYSGSGYRNTFLQRMGRSGPAPGQLFSTTPHEIIHDLGGSPDIYSDICKIPASPGFGVNYLGYHPATIDPFSFSSGPVMGFFMDLCADPTFTHVSAWNLVIGRLASGWSFGDAKRYWNMWKSMWDSDCPRRNSSYWCADAYSLTTSILIGELQPLNDDEDLKEVLLIRGLLKPDDEVVFLPFKRYEGYVSPPPGSENGKYRLVLRDASGEVIYQTNFDVMNNFDIIGGNLVESDPRFFSITVEWDERIAEIQILRNEDDAILGTRQISLNPPSIRITQPTGDEAITIISGTRGPAAFISWEGFDPDGDPLTYSVYISSDGETWIPVVHEWPYNYAEIPAQMLNPNSTYKVMVIASDGARQVEEVAGPFQVVEEKDKYGVVVKLMGLPPGAKLNIHVNGKPIPVDVAFMEEVYLLTGERIGIANIPIILDAKDKHIVEIQGFIDASEGIRLALTNQSNTIIVSKPGEIVFVYGRQYEVKLESEYGEVIGSGWYFEGEEAVIDVEPETLQLGEGIRVAALGWAGDIDIERTRLTLVVDGPIHLEAIWKKQYLLDVESAYGKIVGMGWYDENSEAIVYVEEKMVFSPDNQTRFIFISWSGDATSSNERITVIMDGPKRLTANWKTQHLLHVMVEPSGIASSSGAGWYDEGEDVLISVNPKIIPVSEGVRWMFYLWQGDISSREAETYVKMDSPKRLTAVFRKQYLIEIESEIMYDVVSSTLESTILRLFPDVEPKTEGGGWYFEGERAEIAAPNIDSPIPGIRYILHRWEGPVEDWNSARTGVTALSPTKLTAVWRIEYIWFLLYSVIMLTTVIALLVIVLKRRPKP